MSEFLVVRRDGTVVQGAVVLLPGEPGTAHAVAAVASVYDTYGELDLDRARELKRLAEELSNVEAPEPHEDGKDVPAVLRLMRGEADLKGLTIKALGL